MSFTTQAWRATNVFVGRIAEPHDVEAGRAVFALGDTISPELLDLGETLPQPAIWYDDDLQVGVLIVQAETHETLEGDRLEVLGLMSADGRTAVGFLEDVDFVDATDPAWTTLVEDTLFAAIEPAPENQS